MHHLEIPPHLRSDLFIQKLRQCMVICDFSDPSSELSEKEIKRQTLQEILEYVGMNRGVLTTDTPYPEIVKMVLLLHTQSKKKVYLTFSITYSLL